MPETRTRIADLRSRNKVTILHRGSLPACQAKKDCPNHARIDCKSWSGPWGYTCARCWPTFAAKPGTLGLGIGQYLILDKEFDSDLPTWVN